MARAFFFNNNSAIEDWRQEIALATSQNQVRLEPPITEMFASFLYQGIGNESLASARIFTSTLWLVGGLFLYTLIKQLASTAVAMIALAYYLFVPLGVWISRSFQPDSLMMAAMLFGLLAMVKYFEKRSMTWYLASLLTVTLSILYRPQISFVLLCAFIGLALYHDGVRSSLTQPSFWIFIIISLTPATLYYSYLSSSSQITQRQVVFFSELLTQRGFWLDWLKLGADSVGIFALIAALIGLFLLKDRLPQTLIIALGIGYLLFGLVFGYYVRAVSYYHVQLIPIVAFPLGVFLVSVFERLSKTRARMLVWLSAILFILLAAFLSINKMRSRLGDAQFESIATAREIGDLVNHSNRVVYLARAYGTPLEYYGELTGTFFPRAVSSRDRALGKKGETLSVEQRLDALGFNLEYFVITNFNEFERHHGDLREYLADNCSELASSERYIIYEQCEKPDQSSQ
jgi:hypothetical protein